METHGPLWLRVVEGFSRYASSIRYFERGEARGVRMIVPERLPAVALVMGS
jgi:hypothetical protein